jgi:pimeloyl-ACP methyl ester carboxylesterase
LHDILRVHRPQGAQPAEGLLAVLRALEDDVADYVCRNDLRERVRGFVQQALCRLAARADVDTIVVNAHSQGTVVAFDVLARSAPLKVRALVTAGSPLRKYVDLFAWGDRAGLFRTLMQRDQWCWLNAYDPRDPVADPLRPPRGWRLGDDPEPSSEEPTLFQIVDPNKPFAEAKDCPVIDYVVNNVEHSVGTGLRAHAYWDNAADFIPRLVTLLGEFTHPTSPPKASYS